MEPTIVPRDQNLIMFVLDEMDIGMSHIPEKNVVIMGKHHFM